jgi:hypothetical protein
LDQRNRYNLDSLVDHIRQERQEYPEYHKSQLSLYSPNGPGIQYILYHLG